MAALEDLVNIGFEPNKLVQLPTIHRHHAVDKLRTVPAAAVILEGVKGLYFQDLGKIALEWAGAVRSR
jgi:hypothetical protein